MKTLPWLKSFQRRLQGNSQPARLRRQNRLRQTAPVEQVEQRTLLSAVVLLAGGQLQVVGWTFRLMERLLQARLRRPPIRFCPSRFSPGLAITSSMFPESRGQRSAA